LITDYGSIALIATTAFSIAATTLGLNYKVRKDKVTKLLGDVINAVQDDEVTDEECRQIADDAKAFLDGK
jgi:hypothetical protein